VLKQAIPILHLAPPTDKLAALTICVKNFLSALFKVRMHASKRWVTVVLTTPVGHPHLLQNVIASDFGCL